MPKLFRTLIPALALITPLAAEPLLSSWFTEESGSYAKLYETDEDQENLNAVTTWNRGAGVQELPTYAGLHELSYTEDWVYIRTTNLASYIMGPWYGNADRTNLFANFPANQASIYRLPRQAADPSSITNKFLTGGGPIGYMVNGVTLFDSRDAYSYSLGSSSDLQGNGGDGAWNRDAYINEGVTFDAGFAHQASSRYHYHANPPALRHQLGDSVNYDPATNSYSENFNGRHSPIIGWVGDGLPLYGPYGYSNPLDPESPVRRMISGYQLRRDIAAIGSARDTWPAWAQRLYPATDQSLTEGPSVDEGNARTSYPLGKYMEDNDYKGDLGLTLGVDFDLNEFNVRFCVTPEFPLGTWAYFTCIDADGTPVFPYNIARAYFGQPVAEEVDSIPNDDDLSSQLTTVFEGGPEIVEVAHTPAIHSPAEGDITLSWIAAEGGTYQILQSTELNNPDAWTALAEDAIATDSTGSYTHSPADGLGTPRFYKIQRNSLSTFDDAGFVYTAPEPPLPEVGDDSFITLALPQDPTDLNELPIQIRFNGIIVDLEMANISRNERGFINFKAPLYGLPAGDYSVEVTFATLGTQTISHSLHNNILLMIVDDWGIDRSPLDNPEASAVLPKMPNLSTLASRGLRFTRAYSQPQCSPTRASILTGRHPFQHAVGSPEVSSNFSNSGTDELTLPEIFTTMGAPHAMLSVGKWHLGGNLNAFRTRGGWPEFYGINGGGVGTSYYNWQKNDNGTNITSEVYSTTDQVNHAETFIRTQDANGTPWFTWVAFNAPHSPFEAPPAELAPSGGYSNQQAGESSNAWNYIQMLEALDTEIGRLLESVDPARTHIILIGDNGTPSQIAQAPYGDGHGKSTLYNGGIHVPLIVASPLQQQALGSTNDTLVHCIDLFESILEMADINQVNVPNLASRNTHSTSILPILLGTDSATRHVVAERSGDVTGRTIISSEYPDYKLIIYGDPADSTDTPVMEFYRTSTDANELAPLAHDISQTYQINVASLEALGGDALVAYQACRAIDTALGGGYSSLPEN